MGSQARCRGGRGGRDSVTDEDRANGAFSFTGTAIKNGILYEYSVKVSGKPVSRTVTAGSMTYEKTSGNGPACETTTKFRAKRTGPTRSRA